MDVQYEGKDLEAMSFAPNYQQWILHAFRPYLGARIAEVGAGSGNFSPLLLAAPTQELLAVEPSSEMYPLLEKKFHSNSKVDCVQELFSTAAERYPAYFDTIVYVNVLEHVEHDAQELQYVHHALKAGGSVCIFVPALPWLYSEFDASVGHWRRYRKRQLRSLLQEAGFEIVRLSYFDFLGIIPWFVVFRLFRRKLSPGNTALYDKLMVPLSRAIESVLPVPIGKNLVAVARKKC